MLPSRTSKSRPAFLALAALLAGGAIAEEQVDNAAADSAAAAAVVNARVLDVKATVLDIVGLEAGVAASPKEVKANVEDLKAAMRDLKAEETELEVRIDLSADVLFDFDKADIRPDAAEELAKAATIIRAHPGATVRVIGHTDSKGKDAYNQKLSERRAASVVAWLTEQGDLGNFAFAAVGKGESEPIAPNEKPDGADNPEGRQKNRRVEIIVRKGG
jgi:outer membrane protein OmpA-like peptidoglycan-associated protein